MGSCLFGPRYLLIACFCMFCLPAILPAQSSGPSPPSSPSVQYNLALQALSAENPQEALAEIQKAIWDDPSNLEYQHVLGVAYLRLHRLDEGELVFLTLLNADETRFRKVYLDLADIYMQQQKNEKALEMAEKAGSVAPGRSEYIKGAVYLRLKEYRKAARSFELAARSEPELAPQAMTQQAVAQYHLGNRKEAQNILKTLLKMPLPPDKAEEIKRFLRSIQAAKEAEKPWQISAAVGFVYDSNIFQNPLEQSSARTGVTDQDDGGSLLSLTGRYTIYQTDVWKFGVAYNHYQLIYFQHHKEDLIGERPSLYFQWEDSPYYLNIEYVYSHFWLGSDSFVHVNSLFPSFVVLHGDRWRTVAVSGLEGLLYQDETPDTIHGFLGLTEMYMMRDGKAHVRAGYLADYNKLIPEDRGDYLSHVIMLGFQWPVFEDKWFLDVAGQYIWRSYDHDPTISITEDRSDDEQDLIVQLIGRLTSHLQLTLLVQQTWNDSNIEDGGNFDPYNYRRTVTSCVLTYNW